MLTKATVYTVHKDYPIQNTEAAKLNELKYRYIMLADIRLIALQLSFRT